MELCSGMILQRAPKEMMFSDVSKYQIVFPALSQACNANFFSEKKKALPLNLPLQLTEK